MNLPPYPLFPELTGARILLRQVLATDIRYILEISRYDAKPARTEQEALDMQSKIDADYQNGSSIHWGIIDKETDIIVGTCGYYRGLGEDAGEIGCILRPAFRGQGYMTEAIRLVVLFGITTIGLKKVMAITTKQNDRALKLLDRLHFKKITDLSNDKIKYQFIENDLWNYQQL